MDECVLAPQGAVQGHIRGMYCDLSAVWHRIFCIHHQVHDDLFELTSVRPCPSQTSGQLGCELDVLAD